MIMLSSRLRLAARHGLSRRGLVTVATPKVASMAPRLAAFAAAAALVTAATVEKTRLDARLPTSGDIISTGTPVKEPSTGILFPQLCNGYYLVGTGCRVKYAFVKVYAVGTYMDPLAMSAVKNGPKEAIEMALLDPTYPRTIRIVMNRNLSIEKYTEAIVEALKPRMKGQDLDKLEEFKKLNPPVDLVQGELVCPYQQLLNVSSMSTTSVV